MSNLCDRAKLMRINLQVSSIKSVGHALDFEMILASDGRRLNSLCPVNQE
jgi:hypothetical protein